MANRIWIGGAGGATTTWSTAANWSPATVPITGDNVYIYGQDTMYDIDAGLDASAVTLAVLQVDQSYTGKIGTASAYLQVGATNCIIGLNPLNTVSSGSGRININFGAVQTTMKVFATSQSATSTGVQPVQVLGTHASNALYVMGGLVGVASLTAAEVSTYSTIGLVKAPGSPPDVILGKGVTITTLNMAAGRLLSVDDDVSPTKTYTTFYQSGGTATVFGGTIFTTLSIYNSESKFIRRCTGTITTLNLGNATFDGSQDQRALTITSTNLYKGAKLLLNNGKLNSYTFTNGPLTNGCAVQDVTVLTEIGQRLQLT